MIKRNQQIISISAKNTQQFAESIAKGLKGGETIALSGDLGSGKTVFAKGLAKGLKIKENITSPTFVILKQYDIKLKTKNEKPRDLVHIDCYRLKSAEDARLIGLTDFLGKRDNICIIEWAEKIDKMLPKNTIYICIDYLGKNKRKINIE